MALNFWQRWFPHRALEREIARSRLAALQDQQKRYYDAGTHSSYRPKSLMDDVSPQAVTQHGAAYMRSYARNLDENHHIAISILDSLVNNVIGPGLQIHPQVKNRDGTLNEDMNDRIRQMLAKWSERPTVDRQTTFPEAQRLLARTWLRDGEALVQKLRGPQFARNGKGAPFAIELLEPDYLPYDLNTQEPRLIVQGVHLTTAYEPLAYYLAKVHPGDIWNAQPGLWTNESDYRRVDADRILHVKFRRRINQVRGVSVLHGVIRALEDLKDYEESERIAARVAAAFTGYIKKSPEANTVINPETGNRDLEMSPGMIFDNLLPGEEVGTIDANRPNTAVNDFVGGQIRRIAAGAGANYSTVSRDYEGSYSSQRQSMVEIKPSYDTLRGYFVDTIMRPIYEELIDMARVSGELPTVRGIDVTTLNDMVVPKAAMPWIDPKKEIEADVLRIDNNLASRSQVIAERGSDPAIVQNQIEQEAQANDLEPEPENDEPAAQPGEETAGAENAEA